MQDIRASAQSDIKQILDDIVPRAVNKARKAIDIKIAAVTFRSVANKGVFLMKRRDRKDFVYNWNWDLAWLFYSRLMSPWRKWFETTLPALLRQFQRDLVKALRTFGEDFEEVVEQICGRFLSRFPICHCAFTPA